MFKEIRITVMKGRRKPKDGKTKEKEQRRR
jgi:hypothetical protein